MINTITYVFDYLSLQSMVARLQKEKNQLLDDSEKNKNDADLFHSQIIKYQREKEKLQAELDITEEKYEKAQSMFKKTQVRLKKKYYTLYNLGICKLLFL